MRWTLAALLAFVLMSACDKPCPKGEQRYGVKCVKRLTPDSGMPASDAGPDDDDSDSGERGICERQSGPFYRDADGDGYGTGVPLASCTGSGFAAMADDCDDGNSSIYPSANERCNGVDDDCDDEADESLGDQCDAAACAALACDANAECVLEDAKHRCMCRAGFEGNGKTCSNIDDCAVAPCKNGGVCEDGVGAYVCECPADYTGKDCELEICGSLLIRTRAEMDASRLCAEVHGDLAIDPAGFSTLDSSDLPHLRKVTGDVSLFPGLNSPVATPAIQAITIGAVEAIGGSLSLGPTGAKEVSFPALRSVGAEGDPSALALSFMQMDTQILNFPKLEVIGGGVEFNSMQKLCSANFRKVSKVAGTARVYYTLKLPAEHIRPIVAAAKSTSYQLYGCCIFQGGTDDCGTTYDPFSADCMCSL